MSSQYANALGRELRFLRERAGYYQSEVSALLGLSSPTVSRWENARDVPCLTRIVQMATDVYGVDPQALLVQLARSVPDGRLDDLGIPVEHSVLRAAVVHYFATHEVSLNG